MTKGQINRKIGENPIPKSKAACLGLVYEVSKLLRILSGTFMSIEEHLQLSKDGI